MSGTLPWHVWYHGTWLASESRHLMTLAERGLYRDALDLHYQEGSIPADATLLRRMLGLDSDEFDAAWPNVSKHFRPSDSDPSRLVNNKALDVLDKAEERRRLQSEKGSKGGRPRKKPNKSPAKAGEKPGLFSGKAERKPDESPAKALIERRSLSTTSLIEDEGEWGSLFDEWWEAFPRKVAKSDASKAYGEIVVKGKVKADQRADLRPFPYFADRHAQLVAATKLWAGEFATRDSDKVPYPATFLRRMDWLAAPEASTPAKPKFRRAWE